MGEYMGRTTVTSTTTFRTTSATALERHSPTTLFTQTTTPTNNQHNGLLPTQLLHHLQRLLLHAFDSYSRQNANDGSQPSRPRSQLAPFAPKFDIRETAETYEFHGELPGMTKENVNIEFTDPQNMLIRGKVERTYTAGTSPTGTPTVENKPDQKTISSGTESPKSHKATVEEDGFPAVDKTDAGPTGESQAVQKPAAP